MNEILEYLFPVKEAVELFFLPEPLSSPLQSGFTLNCLTYDTGQITLNV